MNILQIVILIISLPILNFAFDRFVLRRNRDNGGGAASTGKGRRKKKFSVAEKSLMTAIALFPALMGLWAINYWFGEFNEALGTGNWTAIEGKLISKGTGYQTSKGSKFRSTTVTTSYPVVKYSYEYDGKTYISETLDYLNQPAYGDESKTKVVLDKLPDAGEKVTVYINRNGSRSVLFRGTKGTSYFGLIAGIPFFLIGLLGIKLIYGF